MKELPVHRGLQLGCPKCHRIVFRKHADGHFSCVSGTVKKGEVTKGVGKGCGYEWTIEPNETGVFVAKQAIAKANRKEKGRAKDARKNG